MIGPDTALHVGMIESSLHLAPAAQYLLTNAPQLGL